MFIKVKELCPGQSRMADTYTNQNELIEDIRSGCMPFNPHSYHGAMDLCDSRNWNVARDYINEHMGNIIGHHLDKYSRFIELQSYITRFIDDDTIYALHYADSSLNIDSYELDNRFSIQTISNSQVIINDRLRFDSVTIKDCIVMLDNDNSGLEQKDTILLDNVVFYNVDLRNSRSRIHSPTELYYTLRYNIPCVNGNLYILKLKGASDLFIEEAIRLFYDDDMDYTVILITDHNIQD